jgi:hypothetical protein
VCVVLLIRVISSMFIISYKHLISSLEPRLQEYFLNSHIITSLDSHLVDPSKIVDL